MQVWFTREITWDKGRQSVPFCFHIQPSWYLKCEVSSRYILSLYNIIHSSLNNQNFIEYICVTCWKFTCKWYVRINVMILVSCHPSENNPVSLCNIVCLNRVHETHDYNLQYLSNAYLLKMTESAFSRCL